MCNNGQQLWPPTGGDGEGVGEREGVGEGEGGVEGKGVEVGGWAEQGEEEGHSSLQWEGMKERKRGKNVY